MVKQNKLAAEIAELECPAELYFEWCKYGFIVLKRHWNELDFYRINKFLYLVRLLVVACFKKIESRGFKKSVRKCKRDLH
jgi:hypothetical protein